MFAVCRSLPTLAAWLATTVDALLF
jgi:hypothetical protein